jgi:hypothetical protein
VLQSFRLIRTSGSPPFRQFSSPVGFAEWEIIIAGALNLLQALAELFNTSI